MITTVLVIKAFSGDQKIVMLLHYEPPTIRIFVQKVPLKKANENAMCILPSSLKMCFPLILQVWYTKTPLGKARIKALAAAEETGKGKGKGKGKDKGKEKEKKKKGKKGKKKK